MRGPPTAASVKKLRCQDTNSGHIMESSPLTALNFGSTSAQLAYQQSVMVSLSLQLRTLCTSYPDVTLDEPYGISADTRV